MAVNHLMSFGGGEWGVGGWKGDRRRKTPNTIMNHLVEVKQNFIVPMFPFNPLNRG